MAPSFPQKSDNNLRFDELNKLIKSLDSKLTNQETYISIKLDDVIQTLN